MAEPPTPPAPGEMGPRQVQSFSASFVRHSKYPELFETELVPETVGDGFVLVARRWREVAQRATSRHRRVDEDRGASPGAREPIGCDQRLQRTPLCLGEEPRHGRRTGTGAR